MQEKKNKLLYVKRFSIITFPISSSTINFENLRSLAYENAFAINSLLVFPINRGLTDVFSERMKEVDFLERMVVSIDIAVLNIMYIRKRIKIDTLKNAKTFTWANVRKQC